MRSCGAAELRSHTIRHKLAFKSCLDSLTAGFALDAWWSMSVETKTERRNFWKNSKRGWLRQLIRFGLLPTEKNVNFEELIDASMTR